MYIRSKNTAWTQEESKNLFECVQLRGYDVAKTELSTWNQLRVELGFINRSVFQIKKHYCELLKLKEFFDKKILDQLSLKVEITEQPETKEFKQFQKMVSDFKNNKEESKDSTDEANFFL